MKKLIYFGIIICVLLCSCKRPEQYSDIPEIKLISFEKYQDDKVADGALLVFYFQDGEGDIGLFDNEKDPPYDFNFFCDYYEKQHGVFVKTDSVETPDGMKPFNLNARIPRLTKLPEESINGEISLIMTPYYDKSSPYNDTIQIQFHIVDRKLNKSNVEIAGMIRSNE